jgi:hypothetical protein
LFGTVKPWLQAIIKAAWPKCAAVLTKYSLSLALSDVLTATSAKRCGHLLVESPNMTTETWNLLTDTGIYW